MTSPSLLLLPMFTAPTFIAMSLMFMAHIVRPLPLIYHHYTYHNWWAPVIGSVRHIFCIFVAEEVKELRIKGTLESVAQYSLQNVIIYKSFCISCHLPLWK